MLRRMTRVFLLAAAGLVALCAATAFAVTGPQPGTVVLKNYTFESATTADSGDYYSFDTYRGTPTGDYWWGRSLGHGYSGAGLWCAASHGTLSLQGDPKVTLPNAPYGSVNNAFFTKGEADFALDDTTGWFQSDFSYRYLFPDPAPNDLNGDPLKLFWYKQGTDVRQYRPDVVISSGLLNSMAWTQVVMNRTGGASNFPAATAGAVKFEYDDPYVPGLGGTGATLDDIKLDGYKYGPVRNLSVVRGSGAASRTVSLSWAAPYAAANSTTPDTRPITYHVWRYDVSTGTYTEIGSGTSGLTAQDTAARLDGSLTYYVQAYDPANSSFWGPAQSQTLTRYPIDPTPPTGGTISPATRQWLGGSESLTFAIAPSTGYTLSDVKVDSTSQGPITSYTFSSITASHTISASFAINHYAIVPTAGANGSISPGTQSVPYGSPSPAFTITPNTGYHVADVLVDGSSVGPVTTYTFPSVSAAHTISASFAINTYPITPSAGSHGSISPSTVAYVMHGAPSASYTITPDTGYHIDKVLVDGVSVGAPSSYSFASVTAAHTIAASFAINTCAITPIAGTNGSITPNSVQAVPYGSPSPQFDIAPAAHYHIADVRVDGVSVGTPSSYTFPSVIAAHTILATFAIDTNPITSSAGPNGAITPSAPQNVPYGSASPAFTITPDTGYEVADVAVDGTSVGALTSYTFANVTVSHTISATFARRSLSITPSASANGTISPSAMQNVLYGAASPAFTMTPASGYHVGAVLVDGVSVGTPTSYTFSNVTANHTISVTFASNTIAYLPVWRFRNIKLGCHLLVANQAEFNAVNRSVYVYEGVAYQLNPETNKDAVYRFYNKKGGFYMYTADPNEAATIRTKLAATWAYQGAVFNVSHDPAGTPVVRVRNIKGGFYLWTADPNEVANIRAKLKGVWVVEGVAFYIAK